MVKVIDRNNLMRSLSILIVWILISGGFVGIYTVVDEVSANEPREESDYLIMNVQADSPWPCFRGNLNHTGLSPYDTTYNAGKLVWKYETGSNVQSSPVIDSNGTIYIGSNDGYFYALNPNGSVKWKYNTGYNIKDPSPAIDSNGIIYFNADDFYALYPNGTKKWSKDIIVTSAPALGLDGLVYVGSSERVYAIDPDNKGRGWIFNVPNCSIDSTPAVGSDGTIYFVGYDYFYAVYPNGTLRWKYTTKDGNSVSAPAIGSDGTIYFGCQDYFFALYPNGTLRWKYNIGYPLNSSPAIGPSGTIYFNPSYSGLYALNPNGTKKWTYSTSIASSNPAIGKEGTIYFGTVYTGNNQNYLKALNPDGTLRWQYETGDRIHTSPAISKNGTIYFGCHDWYVYAIGGINHPPVSNAGPDQNVTVDQTVYFNGSKTYDHNNDPLTYFWDFGDGKNTGWQSSSEAVHTYNVPGYYIATLKVNDGIFTRNDTCKIWVNGPPIVNAGSDQNVKVDQTVYFNGSKTYDLTNDTLTYFWDFGDGNNTGWQSSSEAVHTYNVPDHYIATLKVTDGIFTRNDTCKIWVNGPPIVNAGTDQNVTVDQTVYFDGSKTYDLTNDALTYKWDFGDGNSTGWQNSSNATHSFSKAGMYMANLTVSDGSFTDIDYCIVKVTSPGGNTYLIFHPFSTTITLYEDSGPIDNAIDLRDYVENDGFKEKLNFTIIGNTNPNCGVTLDSNRFIDIKPAANWNGISYVTIHVSDGLLTDTQNLTIIVEPVNDPPIALSGPDQNVTVNQIVYFDGSGSYDIDGDDLTYQWDFGDGSSTTWVDNNDISHLYEKAGIYTVTLTIKDKTHPPLLTDIDTCIIHVFDSNVNHPPIAVAGPNQNITVGQSLTLDGSGSYDPDGDSITYEWTSSLKGKIGIDAIIEDVELNEGIHTITLKVSDGEFTDSDTCIVRVSDISGNLPPVAKIRSSIEVQEGETVHLSGDDSFDEDGYITQYFWDFGDGTKKSSKLSIINHTWKQFGSYEITLTVTDDDGATGTTTTNIFVIKSINNDTDGDGLPNTWEIRYGLDPNDPDDADLDSDGDTLTNLDEYILGTDPTKFDTDGDGVVDNKDAFPLDPAASLDSDGDQYPDSWNPGKSEKDSTTGLKLDEYPNDPNHYEKQTPKDETSQDYTFAIVLIVIMILILLLFATSKLFILRSKGHYEKNLESDDEMLNKVKNKFLQGEPLKELEYSQNELEGRLERSFKTGQISENTYNSIRSEILYSDEVEFTHLNNSIAKGKE